MRRGSAGLRFSSTPGRSMESTFLELSTTVEDAEKGAGRLRKGRRSGWHRAGAVGVGEARAPRSPGCGNAVVRRAPALVSQHAASRGARPAPAAPCVPLAHIPEYLGGFGRCGSISASLCYSNQGGKQRFGEMVLISGRNSHADTCGPADLKPICRRFCSSLPCFLKDGCGKCYSAFKRGPHIKKSSLGGSRLKSLHTSLEMKTRTRRPLGERPAPGCGRAGGDPIALHTDFLLMACVTPA